MSSPIRRLALITDAPCFGGAERFAISMVRAAQRRGLQACIFWLPPAEPAPAFLERAGRDGVDMRIVDPRAGAGIAGFIREFGALLRSARPDALIINGCGRPRFWLTPWLARLAGVPAVWIQHFVEDYAAAGVEPHLLGGRMEGPRFWRVPQCLRHRLATMVGAIPVALSAPDRELIIRWQRINPERIVIIPPGTECSLFQFNPAGRNAFRARWGITASNPRAADCETFVIGTSARLVPGKGVDILIEATALLRARGVPALLVVAGLGHARASLEALARSHGVGDAVRFEGFVDDMPAFYSALDVFSLCSAVESYGLSLTEAMSCERPVVATPTTAAKEQIQSGCNGWLLKGFTAAEAAEALAALHADPALRERLGRAGRTSATENLDIDLTLERTLRALGAPGPGGIRPPSGVHFTGNGCSRSTRKGSSRWTSRVSWPASSSSSTARTERARARSCRSSPSA